MCELILASERIVASQLTVARDMPPTRRGLSCVYLGQLVALAARLCARPPFEWAAGARPGIAQLSLVTNEGPAAN